MAAIPVEIRATLYDLTSKSSRQVYLVGELARSDVGVGGGPMPPGPGGGGGGGEGIWGPPGPWVTPPIANVPGLPPMPDQPPSPPNEPKPPPPGGGWGWHPEYGWGYFPGSGGAGPHA